MAQLFKECGQFEPDSLIASSKIPVTAKGITIVAGAGQLKRGTVLGINSDGKYDVTGKADGDGKVACDCILADDVDASGTEDVITSAYDTGKFNKNALIVAEGSDVETYETELRKLGIFMAAVQEY